MEVILQAVRKGEAVKEERHMVPSNIRETAQEQIERG